MKMNILKATILRDCCISMYKLGDSTTHSHFQDFLLFFSQDAKRGGHCPLTRDSEPIRLLELLMSSPSLYMFNISLSQQDKGVVELVVGLDNLLSFFD